MDNLRGKTDQGVILSSLTNADGDLNKLKAKLEDPLLKKYAYYFFHQVYLQTLLHIHVKAALS